MDAGRIFRAAHHPARSFLLHRGVLGLLAFDAWLGMYEHAGRYGVGGFNVAHFAWIDAVVPVVTPALYGGLILLTGLLALPMALAGASRTGKALLALAYTSAWLISLHDAYQHHYLISWLLLWLVFVPDAGIEEAGRADAPLARGVGLPLTALTCAIVYGFTGVAKSEPEWRSGMVLKRLSHSKAPGSSNPGVLDPVRDALTWLGFEQVTAWQLIAFGVIALQWVVAIGYVASARRDESARSQGPGGPVRPRVVLVWLALLGAVSFHAFAELGEMFDIGLFSFYMLWIAFVLLAPASWVSWLAGAAFDPVLRLPEYLSRLTAPPLVRGLLALAVAALPAVGFALDVPGAGWAALAGGGFVLVWGGFALARAHPDLTVRVSLAALGTALALWISLAVGPVRFDFYRRTAGELARMERLEEAIAVYRKGESVAPAGVSRRKKIAELEKKLREREKPPAPP
jgi:hypothetical protein